MPAPPDQEMRSPAARQSSRANSHHQRTSSTQDHTAKAAKVQEGPSRLIRTVGKSSRGGKGPRQKGNRAERAIVKFLQDRGLAAERIPLSGSAGGSFVGDLTVPLLGADLVVEVKCRADGWRELYRWLEGRDLLVVKADRAEPLVILPLRLAAEIAAAAEGVRS